MLSQNKSKNAKYKPQENKSKGKQQCIPMLIEFLGIESLIWS